MGSKVFEEGNDNAELMRSSLSDGAYLVNLFFSQGGRSPDNYERIRAIDLLRDSRGKRKEDLSWYEVE